MRALGAAVATHDHLQRRRSPAQRLVRQPTDHCVPRTAFAAAPSAPPALSDNPAGQHSPFGFQPLPDDGKSEAVESSEGGQVRAAEAGRRGSVGHVEVFQMGSVRTSCRWAAGISFMVGTNITR
jgi:hypothetical protein